MKQSSTAMFIAYLMHHSGAFLSILPACIYYADNPHTQQIAYGLLGFGSFFIISVVISSSRDIYDLQERGQFTVITVMLFFSMIYFRWIIAMPGVYWFFYQEWNGTTMIIKVLLLSYLIVFKLVDAWWLILIANLCYGYLFGGKATRKPTKISIASLRRAPSAPINLIRVCSAPLS